MLFCYPSPSYLCLSSDVLISHGTPAGFVNEQLTLQMAEAETELDAMTKDRDELQAVVDELEEKVSVHFLYI